jgi:nicotinamidase-related amidase
MNQAAFHPGPRAAQQLLSPDNCALLLVDIQPQMVFGVQSHDRQLVVNNAVALAKTAKAFGVPTVLTTITAQGFAGPMIPPIQALFPKQQPYDRGNINAWEDAAFVAAVERTGRRRLIVAGLWTEVCVTLPTLSAIEAGYSIYVCADACGGASTEAHERGMQRMLAAGAIPVVWEGVLSELQRDWTRTDTYDAVTRIVRDHGGAWGVGIEYVQAMWRAQAVAA